MRQKRITAEIILGLMLILGLYHIIHRPDDSMPAGRVSLDSGNRIVMGTFARIVAVTTDANTAENCIQAGLQRIEQVDKMMSDYKPDSGLSKLNSLAYKYPVKPGPELFEILQQSIEYSRMTAGAFDITIGPLVDLYRSADEKATLPTDEQISQALAKVGYEKLILDTKKQTVKFAVKGMRLDLGAIAKGYAIDKAVEAIQKAGAIGAMVDIGGDIRCFGAPPPGKKQWRIGVQDPEKAKPMQTHSMFVLKLNNASVATSGDYRRFFTVGGKRYSHIINTAAAFSEKGFSSVTVISEKAINADALATAVSVLGTKRGLKFIEDLPQTEAILISVTPDYKLIMTNGAGRYLE